MDYPIWDFTLGGGMLMALVAIPMSSSPTLQSAVVC